MSSWPGMAGVLSYLTKPNITHWFCLYCYKRHTYTFEYIFIIYNYINYCVCSSKFRLALYSKCNNTEVTNYLFN